MKCIPEAEYAYLVAARQERDELRARTNPHAVPVGRVDGDGNATFFDPIPEQGAYLYAAPPPAQPAAPNDWTLPHHLTAGQVTFKKGVHVSSVIARMELLARMGPPTGTEASAEDRWISVDERLPEPPADDSDVPVWTWDGTSVAEDEYAQGFEQPAGPLVGGWVKTGYDFMRSGVTRQVTHWMPRGIPKPPDAIQEHYAPRIGQ